LDLCTMLEQLSSLPEPTPWKWSCSRGEHLLLSSSTMQEHLGGWHFKKVQYENLMKIEIKHHPIIFLTL
jgi:hypothetical protein